MKIIARIKHNPLAHLLWLPLMGCSIYALITRQDIGYLFEALICWIAYEISLTNN